VSALKEQRCAVAGTLREQVTVMLAANAWLAVQRRGRIALDNEPGSNLAFDGLLQAIRANVAEAVVPERAAHHGLAG
jgi:hypothetical protein